MAKIRALTMLNEMGDTTIAWTEDRDDEMEAIIARKMAEGCVFYIIDSRFGGRMKLMNAVFANRHRALAIPDEDFAKFVGTEPTQSPDGTTATNPVTPPTAVAVPTPTKPAKTVRRAKTAKDVATSESVGVTPRRGG